MILFFFDTDDRSVAVARRMYEDCLIWMYKKNFINETLSWYTVIEAEYEFPFAFQG